MHQYLTCIALVVDDYDDAIRFYTEKLNFILLEDTRLSDTKRWVRVAPPSVDSPSVDSPGSNACALLLAKANDDTQRSRVGNQTGGRVFLFLHTDDLWRDYHVMTEKGVEFTRLPVEEPYGTVAVFKDLYGNLWGLIEPIRRADTP